MNNEQEMSKLFDICHSNLKNSKKLLSYLIDERKLSEDSIKKFKIGFFPQNTQVLTKYISSDFLQDKLICSPSGYSKFSAYHSLIFPINDEYKNPIAIMGRAVLNDNERKLLSLAKYENSSYSKNKFLYGLDIARSSIVKHQNVFVVEGNFDVIAMNNNGIENTVGICGVAFSKYHLIKLAKYTNKITFLLDSDSAGEGSMKKIEQKFSNRGINFRFCKMPKGYKDIDEYFKTPGKTKESFYQDLKLYIPTW